MKKLSNYIPYILISVLLTSCGPTAKLRRAQRLIAKAEAQGATWKIDTVFRDRDIFVKEVKTDTVFESVQGDTVRIEKERLKIKYVNLPGEKVYIEGECEADTIRIQEIVTVNRTIKAGKGFWYYLWRGIGLSVLAVIAGYIVRAMAKKQVNINIGKDNGPD